MLIYMIKQDLRRKVGLVAGGHLIDALDHNVYSFTVKSVSVKLLQMIAHSENLEILCGDISNAYAMHILTKRCIHMLALNLASRKVV